MSKQARRVVRAGSNPAGRNEYTQGAPHDDDAA